MLGAIIGDITGSVFEFTHGNRKDFNVFNQYVRMTDDSYLTLAVMKALMKNYPIDYSEKSLKKLEKDVANEMINARKNHVMAGYGGMFFDWCLRSVADKEIAPSYNSYGNGSAMRISPVAWVANSEEEVKLLSKTVTAITHNHPEGIKGAEAVAIAIYLALHGASKEEIRDRVAKDYYPEIKNFDFDILKDEMFDDTTCQKTVPQAIFCFLISNSLEDAVRNCVALGGDTDTTGAMAGAIAEAYYQKDQLSDFEEQFLYFMIDKETEETLRKFYKLVGNNKLEKRKDNEARN